MARRSLAGARVLLTGASSGIGRALALRLSARGAHLMLTARRETRLKSLAEQLRLARPDAEVAVVSGDVTDPTHREQLVAELQQRWSGLDVLINNAGVGAVGPFADADSERLRRIMEVNFFAPAELIRKSLPLLLSGRRPIVVNVGSVLGHRAVPNKSEYCASKFALHGLSDALRAEWLQRGIDLLLVSPSTTASEFFDVLLEDRPPDGQQPAAGQSAGATRGAMSPDAVARIAVRALERGRHEVIVSAGGRALVWLDRLWPGLANRLVARYGQ